MLTKEEIIEDLLEQMETYRIYMEAAPSGATYSKYRKLMEETEELIDFWEGTP